jgi:hypothetical protein
MLSNAHRNVMKYRLVHDLQQAGYSQWWAQSLLVMAEGDRARS